LKDKNRANKISSNNNIIFNDTNYDDINSEIFFNFYSQKNIELTNHNKHYYLLNRKSNERNLNMEKLTLKKYKITIYM